MMWKRGVLRCNSRCAIGIGALCGLVLLAGCGSRAQVADDHHADAHHETEHGAEAGAATVELDPEALANGGIRVGAAGPAEIAVRVDAPGEVRFDAERVLEVRPRYAGVLRDIRKRIGDRVERDEVLALVQSNESLAEYEIRSSMAGTVIARHVVTGQAVGHETELLTIADLSHVWVDFAIYPRHVGRIRAGTPVTVVAQNRPDLAVETRVRYVGPLLEQDTRVSSARVVLPNPDRVWQPGLFVTARVTLERARVPIAVPEEAILRTIDGPAVFRAEGMRFTLAPVQTGNSDGRTTEVRSGLAAGDSIVVAGAFVLKSELGKSEVAHEH